MLKHFLRLMAILFMATAIAFVVLTLLSRIAERPADATTELNPIVCKSDPDYIRPMYEIVKDYQRRLRDVGPGFYFGPIDGLEGTLTRDAYVEWEKWFLMKEYNE